MRERGVVVGQVLSAYGVERSATPPICRDILQFATGLAALDPPYIEKLIVPVSPSLYLSITVPFDYN
jgi:hypothetical protein